MKQKRKNTNRIRMFESPKAKTIFVILIAVSVIGSSFLFIPMLFGRNFLIVTKNIPAIHAYYGNGSVYINDSINWASAPPEGFTASHSYQPYQHDFSSIGPPLMATSQNGTIVLNSKNLVHYYLEVPEKDSYCIDIAYTSMIYSSLSFGLSNRTHWIGCRIVQGRSFLVLDKIEEKLSTTAKIGDLGRGTVTLEKKGDTFLLYFNGEELYRKISNGTVFDTFAFGTYGGKTVTITGIATDFYYPYAKFSI